MSDAAAESILAPHEQEAGAYPTSPVLTEHAPQAGYAYGDEFAFGLDLILDGGSAGTVG